MFRKLREMAAMSTTGVRDGRLVALLSDGFGVNDAHLVAIATHPFDIKQPRPRAFEDTMRQSCLAFAMQSRNLDHRETVELAIAVVYGYLEMALHARDQHYSEWFATVLRSHEQLSETMNEDFRSAPQSQQRRRSEPLRANRTGAWGP